MTLVRQFYGDEQVPITIAAMPEEVAAAWRSQRARMREWLGDLPEAGWLGPTRCSAWNVTDLVQHLISGAQFLGYTLHEARKGTATRLLAGFDPQGTPGAAAKMFAGMGPKDLLHAFDEVDRSVANELDSAAGDGWAAIAEAPAGHVPAYVSVNHFVFDSWVHERDLMRPVGEVPHLDENEGATVASYVVGLAGAARAIDEEARPAATVDVMLTDLGRGMRVTAVNGWATVVYGAADDEVQVSGTVEDVVDLATGRAVTGDLNADPAAVDYLTRLARLMG